MKRESGSVLLVTGGVLLLAGAGLVGLHSIQEPGNEQTAVGEAVSKEAALGKEGELVVSVGKESRAISWDSITTGGEIDDARVAEKIDWLSKEFGTPAVDARLDLENREIVPEQAGTYVDKDAAKLAIASAWESQAAYLPIPTRTQKPRVTREELGIDDISHVLGEFSTKYSSRGAYFHRSFNLKHAARKLNGFIMKPGEVVSFNEVVGARTEQEGYKIAGVIERGEMVDGLAGGTCQISTTLHGAAFFAGLGIVSQTPHSRPSTYATAGIDATVVYPSVDLKLRNDYDFPVVIQYLVTNGVTKVRILGKKRPYDKIVFQRAVTEELPFETVTREDPNMPVGSMTIDQPGYPGYKLTRYRKFIRNGKTVKTEPKKLRYRPVTEYVRIGINPNPNLKVPKSKKKKNLKEITGSGRMEQ